MCKFPRKLVKLSPVRGLSSVIFSFLVSSALFAQKQVPSEGTQLLNTIDKYYTSINTSAELLPFLCFSPKTLRIYSPDGGSVKLIISSNIKWILLCSEKWISLVTETGSGFNEVIINVMENPESFERTAKIVIKTEGLPGKTIMLSQKARHDE